LPTYNLASIFMMSQESPDSDRQFTAPEIIRLKRDGGILSEQQLKWVIAGLMKGSFADYQMSALLMAIFKEGMTPQETAWLTDAMLYSGEVIEFSSADVVDKHSTGGVGDKSSFVLGPLAAAAGVKVPMMAGRGLGHTGGTVDKVEAIKGYNTNLSLAEFKSMVENHGLSLIGQTSEIAPADKKIYALRDVTATVESIPLITASIMSKKLAEGARGIVMDVKTGQGAFMSKKSEAKKLAKSLMQTASRFDRKMMVFITDMNQPLGRAIGHSNELIECFETLKGKGPKDLTNLSVELAAGMVYLGGKAKTLAGARKKVLEVLHNGQGLSELRKLIERHGGDSQVCEDYSLLPMAREQTVLTASEKGFVASIKTRELGLLLLRLGGGRTKANEPIDMGVGLEINVRLGDKVEAGSPLLTLTHHEHQRSLINSILDEGMKPIFKLAKTKPKNLPPLIYETLDNLGKTPSR
jgi:pyrimidine-nucleoside phosphorylase